MRSVDPFPPVPKALARAVQEFNQREFFACHETLEALWLAERGPARLFYQGIVQIAVGFHHLLRRNARGATRLLTAGAAKLDTFKPSFMGVDVEGLVRETEACVQWLRLNGEAGIARFDAVMIPMINHKEER